MQCLAEPRMFPSIDCHIFDNPKAKTMALSVLVVIEICNALNRYVADWTGSAREIDNDTSPRLIPAWDDQWFDWENTFVWEGV